MSRRDSSNPSLDPDLRRLMRLGVRIDRREGDEGIVNWSFRASPIPRMVKGAGLGLLTYGVWRATTGSPGLLPVPGQVLGIGILGLWAVWLFAFVPFVRLRIRKSQCLLIRGAFLLGVVPVRLRSRNIRVTDFNVSSARTDGYALELRSESGRIRLWEFPAWFNIGKLREETEGAVHRAAILLRRDLHRARR